MGRIKVMDETLANKIAAGEVVERISSVVKELVENSIDAHSNEIKVELVGAGTKEIKVTDNGDGMDEEDAILAFTPHATSKIKNENDLYFISTLGFRGEALASIASVSEVELTTSNGKTGTKVYIKGGKLLGKGDINLNKGTSINVKNLFYNTPARLKFLKSMTTELNNVIGLIEKLSLANPNISFALYSDNRLVIKTTGSGNLLKTIHEIFGYNISKNMIEIKGENLDYEINGYISNINISRSNKNSMITLVNSRIVENSYLNRIIKEAYHTVLAENKYPIVIININTDPTLIDVNIHPTKQDIKFSKMDTLEDLLFRLIKDKLYNIDNRFKVETKAETFANYQEYNDYEPKIENIVNEKSEETYEYVEQEAINFELFEQTNEYNKDEVIIHPVGLALGTYLFANDNENVYMIDIHAANERINYERYLEKLKDENVTTTSMLIPINIELPLNEYNTILMNKDLINNLGIKFEEFGINTFRVTEHPTWLKIGYEEESIRKIFDLIINYNEKFNRVKFNDRLAMTLACKMSVKANTNISYNEQEELLKRLFKCEFPYTCPHGRPTIIKYTKYELEKLFKRVA